MKSLDVANLFIIRHGSELWLTNLSLNKLVYLVQVESLKDDSTPLFTDTIEAWDYGPVEPAVYHAFKMHGAERITVPCVYGAADAASSRAVRMVDLVAKKYGGLAATDLVDYTHRPGGAWRSVYEAGKSNPISVEDMIRSREFQEDPDFGRSFTAGVEMAEEKWSNAIRFLEDA